MTTRCFLSKTSDLIHFRALPITPKSFSTIYTRTQWSIVSKAALRSSSTSNETSLLSTLVRISLCILRTVSVEWNWWWEDWLSGSGALVIQRVSSWKIAVFLTDIATKGRLLTGLKFLDNKSRPKFFYRGSTSADLQLSGTCPFSKDKLLIQVIIGASTSQLIFSSQIGIGSNWQETLVDVMMILRTSSSDIPVSLEVIEIPQQDGQHQSDQFLQWSIQSCDKKKSPNSFAKGQRIVMWW